MSFVVTEEPRYAAHPSPRLVEEMLAAGVRHMPVVDDNEIVGPTIDLDPELAYPGG
jgi:hypothetical protein